MIFTGKYDSPLGLITLAGEGEALTGLWFEGQKHYAQGLKSDWKEEELPVFQDARRWLDTYFGGKAPSFTPPLSPQGSFFRKAVWQILLRIPYGSTVTYGEIARMLEKENAFPRVSARAVGGAVGHNPISLIIPCHRVIGADGSLTGYAGGTERKRELLEREQNGKNVELGVWSVELWMKSLTAFL